MKLTFLGAAGEVTGSQHLIETDRHRLLLDCGFFQGHRLEARRKNEQFYCEPSKLDAVILSHAHIDHSGNLPGLYRAGFRGPIFATPSTADLVEVMLLDSAKIQAEDARLLSTLLAADHPPLQPLYDEEDVAETMKLFEPIAYGVWQELGPDIRIRFQDAGHILGSAIVELELRDAGEWVRLVYTGDLGRRDTPLLRDPTLVAGCDILITETTYADTVHPPTDDIERALTEIINTVANRGGRIVIPAFALGRTQTLMYLLNRLHNQGKLPPIPIYVDSPLSRQVTLVFQRHLHDFDEQFQQELLHDQHPFHFPNLRVVTSFRESAALHDAQEPMVIIASSGMCESGRVLHYLKHMVEDRRNAIVMIGYQAENTLGRRLQERQPEVKILDQDYALHAEVFTLSGLSAHADAEDFHWWFQHLAQDRGVGHAFLVHGEAAAAQAAANLLQEHCDHPPIIPQYRESFTIPPLKL
ncbi:MAG: MBL fold hydrolase [Planctomycetaceae bacterium]|nr:MAG: MBL fold hydrolase [Planctomycetaceae bacterium]